MYGRSISSINTFSAGILATHSTLGFSVLGVGGCLPRRHDWSFLSICTYGNSIRSLSLATLHLLSFEPVMFFILYECIARPPAHPLSDMFLYLFLFIHFLILPLFSFISRWQRGLHGSCTMLQML